MRIYNFENKAVFPSACFKTDLSGLMILPNTLTGDAGIISSPFSIGVFPKNKPTQTAARQHRSELGELESRCGGLNSDQLYVVLN